MKKEIDLVILAGGKGSRINKIQKKKIKSLIKFNNIPFIYYLLNFFCKFNFRKIYIIGGFRGILLKKKFHKIKKNFVEIECLIEKKNEGTGGALRLIKKKVKNNFFLINGDSFIDFNIMDFYKLKYKNFIGSMLVTRNIFYKENKKLNNLLIKKNILYFAKKGMMNAGVYFFDKKIFNFLKNKNFSLEQECLPQLIYKKKLLGVQSANPFVDIGTKLNYNIAKKTIPDIFTKPAFFFDRDGVINYNYGYVHNARLFRFRPGVLKALKFLQEKNYYIFIVTNQAGIAKNKFSLNKFILLSKTIKKFLCKKNIFVNDIQFCPHHPDGLIKKFKITCNCRKPNNGMIKNILKFWLINKKKSFMIGDQKSDEQAARKSKIKFRYVEKNLYKQVQNLVNNY
jgi:D,D-heptose 1,7-bisphosphate phosphatase